MKVVVANDKVGTLKFPKVVLKIGDTLMVTVLKSKQDEVTEFFTKLDYVDPGDATLMRKLALGNIDLLVKRSDGIYSPIVWNKVEIALRSTNSHLGTYKYGSFSKDPETIVKLS